jgi:hypothetical protein
LPTVAEPLAARIQTIARFAESPTSGRASAFWNWMADSWRLRFQLRALRRELRAKTKLNRYMVSDLIRAIKEHRLLNRRMTFLKAAHRLLHHWHLIHRPFALVMFVIMGIHILVTALLGYTWIF